MAHCKFCGVADGENDRRGAATHINRDGLCTACYRVLRAVRIDPTKVSPVDYAWYLRTCKDNAAHGRFVPVYMRRVLKRQWACKRCGRTTGQDANYKVYCASCADVVRRDRQMPPNGQRKTRSDKGKGHVWGTVISK